MFRFLQGLEYRFLPTFLFTVFPILWVISNYELFYLLNDEIIFDCVLLLLVIYINFLLSTMNLKSYIDEQEQSVKISIFIVYYLVTSRYFLLRKKKYDDASLIVVIDSLDKLQNNIFEQYTSRVYNNILNDIKDHLVYKLRTIVSMKRIELVQSIKHSYKDKLFILI